MGLVKEFREFALKGNVVDMAIGIIIGAAFGRIVSSLVEDVLTPPLGLALGGLDFGSLFLSLNGTPYASLAEAKAAGAPTLNYGVFLQSIVDFVIVAGAIFLMIRAVNQARRKEEEQAAPAVPPGPSDEQKLLSEIRDLLRAQLSARGGA